MTIYAAFHVLYFLIHTQCFFLSIPADPPYLLWQYALSWIATEVFGHLAIGFMNWLLKKNAPAPAKTPDTTELEAEMKRYAEKLQEATRLLEQKVPLLEQENRELKAKLQAITDSLSQDEDFYFYS